MQANYQLLAKISQHLINEVSRDYTRYLYHSIDRTEKVIGIMGERGAGKSYLLLQHAQEHPGGIYISADNSVVLAEGLFETVFWIVENTEIRTFYIDELFRYPERTRVLKNLIDSIPNINIYFSGSSSVHLYSGMADLGRRTRIYTLHPLSFTEYCEMKYGVVLPRYSFIDILTHHTTIVTKHLPQIKDIYRHSYLRQGYYPYGISLSEESFDARVRMTLEKIIIEDLPSLANFQTISLDKCSKLFYYLANNLPSELSIQSLAQKIGIDKTLLDNILYYLSQIGIIQMISKSNDLSDKLRKSYKIFLGNPSVYHAYCLHPSIGTLRESFAMQTLKKLPYTKLALPASGDIHMEYEEKHYIFEIGGKKKSSRQVIGQSNGYILVDDMIGGEKKIPLWLLGLL